MRLLISSDLYPYKRQAAAAAPRITDPDILVTLPYLDTILVLYMCWVTCSWRHHRVLMVMTLTTHMWTHTWTHAWTHTWTDAWMLAVKHHTTQTTLLITGRAAWRANWQANCSFLWFTLLVPLLFVELVNRLTHPHLLRTQGSSLIFISRTVMYFNYLHSFGRSAHWADDLLQIASPRWFN